MNKKMTKWVLATIIGLALLSCNKNVRIEPAEVVTPRNEINTETLESYKNSLLGRPIVMAMHYGWGADGGSGAQLYRLPDYLDVVVVKDSRHQLLGWMEKDLSTTQQVKKTKVLNAIDFHAIDTQYADEFKTKFKRQRDKLRNSWKDLETPLTPEEQAEQLANLEKALTEELHTNALAKATKDTEEQVDAISKYGFDGICVKLPENFQLITKEEATQLLSKITAVAGGANKAFLAIEAPFEEARAEIEKATWIIFNKKVLEYRLSNFENEALQWKDNRYLPSASFKGKDQKEGFMDETHFSLDELPRMQSILYWQAPNKAGVAYYHTELDASNVVETMPYGTLTSLIDKQRVLNK